MPFCRRRMFPFASLGEESAAGGTLDEKYDAEELEEALHYCFGGPSYSILT